MIKALLLMIAWGMFPVAVLLGNTGNQLGVIGLLSVGGILAWMGRSQVLGNKPFLLTVYCCAAFVGSWWLVKSLLIPYDPSLHNWFLVILGVESFLLLLGSFWGLVKDRGFMDAYFWAVTLGCLAGFLAVVDLIGRSG